MDPAQEFEAKVLRHQEPMNAVIDRFESPVQQFYCGATVLVTGGSGFLGVQLVEKIFRSTKINKIYLLLRPKKGKTMQERLNYMLKDPVYDRLRDKQPNFAERLVVLEGDVGELGLGLSEKDRAAITEEVNIIFHMAATVRFDEPLRAATLINVRGTREAVSLAHECRKLKSFVYVSTAYTQATFSRAGQEVREELYSCPVSPDAMIAFVETIEEDRLDSITANLIKDWPNTYTFTKTLAEHIVRDSARAGLPACIVRPAIVVCAHCEPMPGWLNKNAMGGCSAIMLGGILGIVHLFPVEKTKRLSVVPVDCTNNAIIVAAWDSCERCAPTSERVMVYTLADDSCFITFGFISKILHASRSLFTNKAVWFCYLFEVKNTYLYWVLKWFLHYIPAYALDLFGGALGVTPKGTPSVVKSIKQLDKQASVFSFFLRNEWFFKNDNTRAMINRMSEEDKAIYKCDLTKIDYEEYVRIWLVGVRKYFIKDGLKETVKGERKQFVFMCVNIMIVYLCVYILYSFGVAYINI